MDNDIFQDLANVLGHIPNGLFILTAAYDQMRSGVLVRWVQPCCDKPPMIMLAMPKGLPVEPLIRDSRSFALCQLGEEDRFLHLKFATPPVRHEDPFVAIPTYAAPSGAPIIQRSIAWLDCELIRHVDLETNCALYIGQVHHGKILNGSRPAVQIHFNGVDTPLTRNRET